MIHIPKLIRNTLSISYHFVYVTMRMTVNPIVYSAISNEVPQLCCESTVYRTSLKILRHQLKLWNMMRCHNNMLCLALTNSLFDESTALSMLLIKPFTVYHNATILNTIEIIYSALG